MFFREARFQQLITDIDHARQQHPPMWSETGEHAAVQVAVSRLTWRGRIPEWLDEKAKKYDKVYSSPWQTIQGILGRAQTQKAIEGLERKRHRGARRRIR